MKPETLQTLSQVAIFIGFVLMALGGFGSYYFGRRIQDAREQASNEQVSTLQQNIEGLADDAKVLQERLAPFEEIAQKLHPNLERDEALGKLRVDMKRLESRASVLEKRTAARNLSDEQAGTLSLALRQRGAHTIGLSAVVGDQEARNFAEQLKRTLEAADWTVHGVNLLIMPGVAQGLMISVKTDPPPQVADDLFQALQTVGLTATGMLDPKASDPVCLVVGSKND